MHTDKLSGANNSVASVLRKQFGQIPHANTATTRYSLYAGIYTRMNVVHTVCTCLHNSPGEIGHGSDGEMGRGRCSSKLTWNL